MFPESFNPSIYKKLNPDLEKLDNEQLFVHYNVHGMKEGRIANEITDRNLFKKYINTSKLSCLEIGPFDDPVIKGKNVKYFDVLTQDELKVRATKCKRRNPIENIPHIDYVDSNGKLNIIKDKFDIVLSCHSIEHQLDFIQHLLDVDSLLNEDGKYVLIVPDKRYCFDHFIAESTIADILQQHHSKSEIHLLKSVIEHRALTCHNNVGDHWDGKHGEPKHLKNPEFIDHAISEYFKSVKTREYLDVHSLQFTPESFRIIIKSLHNLNFINFTVEQIYPTVRNRGEFFVVLKKNPSE